MNGENFWNDQKKAQAIIRETNNLKSLLDNHHKLKEAIEENIQKEKAAYQKEILDSRGLKWSDADVNMEDQSLHIMMNGKKLSYELTFSFSDKENKSFETAFSIPVEFPEYENEIKKIVLQTIVDKFF